MMTTATLLIGYYHGLLLRSIDADMLTNKMCSVGLLTAHEKLIISSGHSVYQRNWLLLYHVHHMDVQSLSTFCELVEEIWPQIGSQLIAGVWITYSSLKNNIFLLYTVNVCYFFARPGYTVIIITLTNTKLFCMVELDKQPPCQNMPCTHA